MNCLIALKNGEYVHVDNFQCIEAPNSNGEIKSIKQEDIEKLNILDSTSYTIIGDTILKIKGEQILYLHFK